MHYVRFLVKRFIQFLLTVWIGVTVVFFVPRIVPSANPVAVMMAEIQQKATYLNPDQIKLMKQQLLENFGLTGTLWSQYFDFLNRIVITHNFGPSLTLYPTPVNQLIAHALPWTLGLLLPVAILAWLIGNGVGLLAGYRANKPSSAVMEGLAIFLYPVPYFIIALILIILFTWIWPIFPLATSFQGVGWAWVGSVLKNSFLPGLSILVPGLGWWVISMKSMAAATLEEDHVTYAKLKGLSERRIMTSYVMRNALLPQITGLALGLGGVFGGALLTEVLFNYPGVGSLLYNSISANDYNLMMGTVSLSIIGVAGAVFVVDLIYPLFDPRIRHK